MQLEVLWGLLLQADPEGPTLISCTVTHTLYKSALMAHHLQLINDVRGLKNTMIPYCQAMP
jgi:hypothetical protein